MRKRHTRRKSWHLEEYIRQLRAALFGRKTEKRPQWSDNNQFFLFDEAEVTPPEVEETSSPEVVIGSHTRRKPGHKPLPPELPRVEVIHDIAESQKICACGASLSRIGEEICEKLRYHPCHYQGYAPYPPQICLQELSGR